MKEIQYRKFSWGMHKRNWKLKRPNTCQFELTFKCGLNCNYCYTSCYNKPSHIKKELNTEQIKFILDKVYNAGVIWLCFSGGDPLARGDFLDIYTYAKSKGFIISIFTNGYSMTEEIADYLVKNPPFVIEVTLNGATKATYEKISGIKDSFEKTIKGIKLILGKKIPLKIKTQVTVDNLGEQPKIKEFVQGLGSRFRPSVFLQARLDGNLTPCSLRIKPEEFAGSNKKFNLDSIAEECKPMGQDNYLFQCTIGGGDGIYIDPYGNLVPCSCIREPRVSLFKKSVEEANKITLNWVRSRTFTANAKCNGCLIRGLCYNCPGKAILETGSLEGRIEWYCELARLTAEFRSSSANYREGRQ